VEHAPVSNLESENGELVELVRRFDEESLEQREQALGEEEAELERQIVWRREALRERRERLEADKAAAEEGRLVVAQFLAARQALERLVRPPKSKVAKVDGASAGGSGTSQPTYATVAGPKTPGVKDLVSKIESTCRTVACTDTVAMNVSDAAEGVSHCSGNLLDDTGGKVDGSEVREVVEENSDSLVVVGEDGEDIDHDDVLSMFGEFDVGGGSSSHG
jgi:hypothetical protein